MYVCICHAVTEGQVRAAVRTGATNVEDLQRQLKVSTCCGACVDNVVECLEQELREQPALQSLLDRELELVGETRHTRIFRPCTPEKIS